MKISLLNVSLFCMAFFLFSCNSSESESSGVETTTATTSAKGSKADTKTASCLADFNHDYSKLLTKQDVLKHVSTADAAVLEIKYDAEEVKKRPEYGEIYYEWPSDRPDIQINPSFPLKQPDMNSVSLTNLKFSDREVAKIQDKFHTAYKTMTQEEVDAGMKRLEESYKDKPAEDLQTAQQVLKKRAEWKSTPLDGVGEYAYWFPSRVMNMYMGSKIIVLTGNAQFEVVAKVGENDEENFEVAKKIALEVLSKCK